MKFLSALFHPAPGTPEPPVVVDASENPDWSEWKLTITPSSDDPDEFIGIISHPRLLRELRYAGSKSYIMQSAAYVKENSENRWAEIDERNARIKENKAKGPEVIYL
jgi:hypothetical protein